MRLLIAILFPPFVFFTIKRPLQGVLNLLLMITIIGWPIAAIWAVYSLSQYKTDTKIKNAMKVAHASPIK